ncbi:mce associated protein mas1a [Rhodococcus triatomae]|uniref:mce associated protein mas1a n=1 Tax=Rhodococcus triatomae TaxID=300028 RepID=UPI0009F455B7|nr:mce associated protein mas1a [Rhodococcus triatomae]QNG19642.1 mce associated protein mas1a [Rhodococcus triatomae]QNG24443.1 mce associated protein mas1a [Rhodococcus triatomae]
MTSPAIPPEASTAAGDGRRTNRVGARTILAGALVLALVAFAAVMTVQVLSGRGENGLRTEAVDVARDYAVAMSSFDYQNLDANRETIAEMSTPAFAHTYNEMVDALAGIVTDGQGQATATAEHVAVESLDDGRAVVLVFADQQAVNVTAPEGNTQKYRMVLTLVRDGDRWLVDDVQTI